MPHTLSKNKKNRNPNKDERLGISILEKSRSTVKSRKKQYLWEINRFIKRSLGPLCLYVISHRTQVGVVCRERERTEGKRPLLYESFENGYQANQIEQVEATPQARLAIPSISATTRPEKTHTHTHFWTLRHPRYSYSIPILPASSRV